MEELQKKNLIDIYEVNSRYFIDDINDLFTKSINLDEINIKKIHMDHGHNNELWTLLIKLYDNVKVMKINAEFFTIEKDDHNSSIEIYINSNREGYYKGYKNEDYNYMMCNLPIGLGQLIIYIGNDFSIYDGITCAALDLRNYPLNNLPPNLKLIKIKTFYDITDINLCIYIANMKLPHGCKFKINLSPINSKVQVLLHNFENIEELIIESACNVKMCSNGKEIVITGDKYSNDIFYNL
jgi:hypothetical protein